MKKKLHSIAAFILFTCILSASAVAQEVPGGAADATATTSVQPLGVHFTRNNGDGTGLIQAQIKLYYTAAPAIAPVLTQITYQGLPLFVNFAAVTADISNYANTGYVTFNIPASNIPPAIKLTLTYRTGYGDQQATISGTD
jgi:hypothetical protein